HVTEALLTVLAYVGAVDRVAAAVVHHAARAVGRALLHAALAHRVAVLPWRTRPAVDGVVAAIAHLAAFATGARYALTDRCALAQVADTRLMLRAGGWTAVERPAAAVADRAAGPAGARGVR